MQIKLQSTFKDYINQLRIVDALALISEGKSITEAALESGFTTIRTFNRAFKRIHGVSPRQYISALPPSAKDSST
jgi:LacI family transcriptional regulator